MSQTFRPCRHRLTRRRRCGRGSQGHPRQPPEVARGDELLTIGSAVPLFSDSSQSQLNRLHAVPGPAGRPVELTGIAQSNRDSVDAITSRLPGVLGLIAVITFGLLFLLTGSVVLPLKALVLNMLSLTAAFGALVCGSSRTVTLVRSERHPPELWSPIFRCCCSASLLACRWTTRFSCYLGSANTGCNRVGPVPTMTRVSHWDWLAPAG